MALRQTGSLPRRKDVYYYPSFEIAQREARKINHARRREWNRKRVPGKKRNHLLWLFASQCARCGGFYLSNCEDVGVCSIECAAAHPNPLMRKPLMDYYETHSARRMD